MKYLGEGFSYIGFGIMAALIILAASHCIEVNGGFFR